MHIQQGVKKHSLPSSELEKPITFDMIKDSSSTIPDIIKDMAIKQLMHNRMLEYKEKLISYKEECKILQEKYDSKLYKKAAMMVLNKLPDDALTTDGPNFPPYPMPNYRISEEQYKGLINETLQRRPEWEPLLKKRRRITRFRTLK